MWGGGGGHIPFTWACIHACICWNSGLQVCVYDFTLLYIYICCYHNQIMASASTHSSYGAISVFDCLLLCTDLPGIIVTACSWNKNIPSCTGQISLKNKLQYVYFENCVKFVNCIHHKPPRTASIFLTRHLGLLTRHHGRCHATSVISIIYFAKTMQRI